MTTMKLRWGIIACGNISGDFVAAVSLLPKEEHAVVAAAASNIERAQSFLKKHQLNDAIAYGSYDELFGDANVDVVYVGNLNHQHESNVLAALEAGKHVLCEKPMGINVAQVHRCIEAARRNKRFLMEGFWSRCFPVWKDVRKEVESGDIGDVNLISADFGYMNDVNKMLPNGGGVLLATGCYLPVFAYHVFKEKPVSVHTVSGWKTNGSLHIGRGPSGILNRKQGGGFVVDIGCYMVLLTNWLFHNEPPLSVHAVGWLRDRTGLSTSNGVDDTASITLKFADNRMAHLLYSGSSELKCQAQITGSKGRIMIPETFWCPPRYIKTINKPVRSETIIEHPLPDTKGIQFCYPNAQGLAYEATAVKQCIENGLMECPEMTWKDSVIIHEILQEIRRQLGVKYPQDDDN